MLISGIFLLLLTGLCWVGIAAVVRDSSSRNLDIGWIQFYTSGSLVLIAAAVLLLNPLPDAWSLLNRVWLLIPLFFAGIINYIMLYLIKIGMRTGNPGAVWGIVQSAFVCPFTMGIVFFGVAPTAPRIIGLLLIVAGIALFSRDRSPRSRSNSGKGWLIPTWGAFLISGLCQSFSNIPSYMTDIAVPPSVRVLLVQSGTISAFAAAFLFSSDKQSKNSFQPIFKPVPKAPLFTAAGRLFSTAVLKKPTAQTRIGATDIFTPFPAGKTWRRSRGILSKSSNPHTILTTPSKRARPKA